MTWHPTKPCLASCSTDGSVVAFLTDGSKLKVLQQSGAVSGCAWGGGYLLATTSYAGPVYVYDLNSEADSCLVHCLLGHPKRSFSVLWSPLPHLLLSGSDDTTARVWDTHAGSCVALLAGHKTEVRALCWHPEVPWLVLTGSWDATIRCWDWRRQSAVYVCHAAPQRHVRPLHQQQLPVAAGVGQQGLHAALLGLEGVGSRWAARPPIDMCSTLRARLSCSTQNSAVCMCVGVPAASAMPVQQTLPLCCAGVLFCFRPPDHVLPNGRGAAWAGRVVCWPC